MPKGFQYIGNLCTDDVCVNFLQGTDVRGCVTGY